MNCGVVIARCVCGDAQKGASIPSEGVTLVPMLPKMQSSNHGGFLVRSPKFGFDSPKVKLNLKRLKPNVNSFTRLGLKRCRQLTARFLPIRPTSPRGGNPG